jgi:hypothetical protein
MRARLFACLAPLALAGCAYTVQVIDVRDAGEVSGPDYVIVKIQGQGEKVYDCYSKPDGKAWAPECVQVEMNHEPRK